MGMYVSAKATTVRAGDLVVRQKITGRGFHFGTGVADGLVAHTTPGRGKQVVSEDEFAETQIFWTIRYDRSPYEMQAVVQRALSDLGKPFNALTANCEHDTSRAQIGTPYSPTVSRVALVGLFGLIFLGITSN